jgi:hypothetical protein
MFDGYQTIGTLIFGVVFIISGGTAIIKKKVTFRYRRGTVNPSAIGVLSGTPAFIFGISALIGGLIMILPIILSSMNMFDTTFLTFTSIIGIGLFVLGLLFSSIIQVAISWGERIQKNPNKGD